jgi:hypothetical protein
MTPVQAPEHLGFDAGLLLATLPLGAWAKRALLNMLATNNKPMIFLIVSVWKIVALIAVNILYKVSPDS